MHWCQLKLKGYQAKAFRPHPVRLSFDKLNCRADSELVELLAERPNVSRRSLGRVFKLVYPSKNAICLAAALRYHNSGVLMNRGDLSSEQWERLKPLLPPQKAKTGKPNHDHRQVVNGILWILRTGAPWRDLPECYGKWPSS